MLVGSDLARHEQTVDELRCELAELEGELSTAKKETVLSEERLTDAFTGVIGECCTGPPSTAHLSLIHI